MSYILKTDWARKENYGMKRALSKIKYLVIHYTGNDGDTDESNGLFFRKNVVKASAHYFVDDDSVTQSVPDDRVAYSVGGKKWKDCVSTGGGKLYGKATNANTLNIELCDTKRDGTIAATEATLSNAVELCKVLMKKYGIDIDHVIRHFDVNGKHCPAYFMDETEWNKFKSRLTSTSPSQVANPDKKTIDVKYQAYTKKNKWLTEIVNYNEANGNGYSGVFGNPILGFRAKTLGRVYEAGFLEYRVHKKGGKWFSWRTDYTKDSSGDTFAGNCKNEIDGLQCHIVGINNRHVRYRVHIVNGGWLDWVTDYSEGSTGYAGIYGRAIDGVQIQII